MNLENTTRQVIELVKTVGDFIREEAGKVKSEDIEIKFHNNLVSYVDTTSEKRLVAGLKNILPNSGFIGEEGTVALSDHDYQWIIDPLDGTTNFLHNIPSYAISVALAYKGVMQIGVVYELNLKECFYAWKGGGAFLNDLPIAVSKTNNMKAAFFSTGFPYYDFEIIEPYIEVLKYLMLNTKGIRRLGAAAVDLCYVACGRYDAYFEHSLHAWDVAAGSLIVTEAGGTVSDFNGEGDYIYGRKIVATNQVLNQQTMQLIQKHLG